MLLIEFLYIRFLVIVFNIIFLNGAGVYFMYHKLLTFFDNIEKENKLLAAVSWDLKVLPYYAACKALLSINYLLALYGD